MRLRMWISKGMLLTVGICLGADPWCGIGSERHGGIFVVPERGRVGSDWRFGWSMFVSFWGLRNCWYMRVVFRRVVLGLFLDNGVERWSEIA